MHPDPAFEALVSDGFDFNSVVRQNDYVAVLFYPSHTRVRMDDIIEEYENAAYSLHMEKFPLLLCEMDVTKYENRYHVLHYKIGNTPKIKIFKNRGRKIEDYNGPRHREGIMECLKRISARVPAEINSVKDADELIGDKKKIVIVGVFPDFSGQVYENFIAAAEILKWHYDIGATLNANNLPRGDRSVSGPVVKMFLPFHDGSVDMETFTVDTLLEFVRDHSNVFYFYDLCQPLLFENYLDYPGNDKVVLYINPKDEDVGKFVLKYHEVATKYKGQGLIFMLGDLEASKRLRWFFGLTTSEDPLIVIKSCKGKIYGKRYLVLEQLELLVDDYKAGRVTEFSKSEPIPVKSNEPVTVVVADTFEELVMASDKNVLLELYRPEFTKCEDVDEVLHEVALYFKESADIVIAKLDESANDIRGEYPDDLRTIGDSPTLYFIPSGGLIYTFPGDITTERVKKMILSLRNKPEKKPRKLDMARD